MRKKRKIFLVLIFVILIAGIFVVGSAQESKKVSEEVYEELEKNEVSIIIKVEPEKKIFKTANLENSKREIIKKLGKEEKVREYQNLISVKVSKQELEELEKNSDIKKIFYSHKIKAFLQDSVPLINVTNVWPIQISNINITGENETICVIDTGINFSHSALVGKNLTCNIDCYNKNCVENCSISDDNGHGTHVAGIAVASGRINGAAINASLIGLKVLDSNGNGHPTTSELDLTNAIDWCVENRNAYNISVISMSLGTNTLYDNYCDSTFSTTWTRAINNATSYNISVIAATGNDGDYTSIASPSCIQNTIAVGWSNKDDTINSNSNRNNLTDLFAPGTNINSTFAGGSCLSGCTCSSDYMICSGTSMSTPHVAGAFALVRQFYRLQNSRAPTPSEIQDALNDTGKIIDDSSRSGLNFSRIDVFSAIISLDNVEPNVSLISPVNNHINQTANQTFSCNATDSVQLKNITLQIWNSLGELYYNVSNKTSGTFSEIEFNTILNKGNYEWNCLVYDANNNYAYASSNFSLYIGNISVSLTSPSDNVFTNQNQTNFTCLFQTASIFELKNSTFFIWNSTNDLIYNSTINVSGTSNSTIFQYNFTEEGNYSWNCLAYNNASENSFAGSNYTITYDTTGPVISSIASSVTINSAGITWITNENANSSVNYGSSVSLGSYECGSDLTTSHSISLSGLSSSTTYYYNVSSCDEAENCQNNGTYSFTTSSPSSQITTSGGGGGGGVSYQTYTPTIEQVSEGYTKELRKNDKIKFTFFVKTEQHTLSVNYVGKNFVNITIKSSPIKLILGVGQSTKLNLTSPDYYDLYVKLEEIVRNKAKLTIQTIHEERPKIPKPSITGEIVEEEKPKIEEKKEQERYPNVIGVIKNVLITILIISIILITVLLGRRKVKIKKEAIKEYKEKFKKDIKPKKKRK